MCGFAGFHASRDFPADAAAVLRKMGDRLQHRGPDDAGYWVDPVLKTALAFRRLSILDLSELGHQPMLSADGRFVLALNGEIYNHQALRKRLEQAGHHFRSHSDTEVLLAGISAWGLEATLKECVGMFAIALIDVRQRSLQLARDRMGEKPLYYGWSEGHFFFGSEPKAFRPHPNFVPRVDRRALTLYVRYGYVPSPYCILAGFHKLMPGHILTLPLDGSAAPGKETSRAYWSVPIPQPDDSLRTSPEECANRLEELLRDAIRMQMLADVPVGAFLSGGIDSSTVVSLMQAQATTPARTFTIGFPDADLDESGYAEKIAKHLGTEHTTLRLENAELQELALQIPSVYCEPFADDSQVPTLALARLARRQVTVALSGDGGDELFLGYGRYRNSLERWQQLQRHPEIRTAFKSWNGAVSALLPWLSESPRKRRWRSTVARVENQWLPPSLPALYRHRISLFKSPELYLSEPQSAQEFFDEAAQMPALQENISWLSYLDLNTYLPDDLLVKVDRAAMAVSLETRMPMLDHRVIEFAAQVPQELKLRGGRTKWPLRQVLEKRVPPELTERRKMGFNTPMGRWLRGPLREWAENLLAPDRLRREGFFQADELQRLWREHQQGGRERGLMLWGVLVFQAWHESF